MMDDESETRAAAIWLAGGSPTEHFVVAIGIAEGHNRLPANEAVDADGFAGTVVDKFDLWFLHEKRDIVLQLVLHNAAAAHDLLRRDAVGCFNPRAHELDAAAGD